MKKLEIKSFDFRKKGLVLLTYTNGTTEVLKRNELSKYVYKNVRYFPEVAHFSEL